MRLQTIVALTDFSTAAEHALDRAARLAAAHGAYLRILFGTEVPDPQFADPQARLEQRARQLARRHGVPVKALQYRDGDVAGEALRAAAGADLLVLDRRPQRGLGGFWRGGTLTRILRAGTCPVLVVQQPGHGAYAHVLVAVDGSPASDALVRYAGGLETVAAMELFHAGGAQAPAQAVCAPDRLVRLSDAFDARRNRVGMATGMGDMARQLAVQQERSGADLVALAHRRRGALADALLGGVTRRLLRGVGCDVLVYPHGRAQGVARGAGDQPRVARRCTQAM